VGRYERVYVVELNRDGQMQAILQAELPELATRFMSLAHLDGMPLTARWVVEALMARETEKPRKGSALSQAREPGATATDLPGDGASSSGNGTPAGDNGLTDMGRDVRSGAAIIDAIENREN
jgi:2-oxoglutarate ferredoxin oxidoreductase subunit alpha